MKKLNWKIGTTTKEILDNITNKKQIETFNEFKNYNHKFVVVKFADQNDFLIGKIYNDNNIWCIEFWNKIRGGNKRDYQIINEAYIPYKYKTYNDRIEELYLIDSKLMELGK